MAPLPADSTPRYKVNYNVTLDNHSFQVRSHASPGAIGVLIDAFLTALADALYGITIISVEFAADGSNVFLPVTTGIEANVYSSGSPANDQRPWFYGFQGRGAGGKKWHLDMFGARSLGSNYLVTTGEIPEVDDAIVALQSFGSDLVAIDDTAVTVYNYANAGVNAHFQRALR